MRYGATMASMVREAWTDERLDDLKASVDAGFGEMRHEFRAVRDLLQLRREQERPDRGEFRSEFQAVRGEIQGVREGLSGEIQGVRGEIQGVRDEVAALNRSFQQLTWGLIGAMLVGFLGTTAAIVTQL